MINMWSTLISASGYGEQVTRIPYDVKMALQSTFMILMSICAIAMIVVVLMQKSQSENMQAIAGGKSESFYGKNKSQSKEGRLRKATIILGVLMALISITYFIIQVID